MASLKNSHYGLGYSEVEHRGRIVPMVVGNSDYDHVITNLEDFVKLRVGNIPAGFEHRPDLISNIFFNTPNFWWLILLVNNVSDPFEGLSVGDKILIPES